MTAYADLEIELYREDADGYRVVTRFQRPDDQAVAPPVRGRARFEFQALTAPGLEPAEHGLLLSRALFDDPRILQEFREACTVSEAAALAGLRIRLRIDPGVR